MKLVTPAMDTTIPTATDTYTRTPADIGTTLTATTHMATIPTDTTTDM